MVLKSYGVSCFHLIIAFPFLSFDMCIMLQWCIIWVLLLIVLLVCSHYPKHCVIVHDWQVYVMLVMSFVLHQFDSKFNQVVFLFSNVGT